jgi:hypothetical protein
MCAGNDIAIAISIYITGRCNRDAHIAIGVVAFYHSCSGRINAGRRTVINESCSFIRLATVVSLRTDDNVRIAISIYITGSCNRKSKPGVGLVAFQECIGCGT